VVTLFLFCQTPISWKSGKQRTIARSFTEVEYKALEDGTTDVIWLQYLLTDLQVPSVSIHYQKFAKYKRIYQRNISVGNLRSELPTDTFPSVIQSITTDGNFSVRNSVGSYQWNYGQKSFRIKKKAGR